jgi:hypothetical protein
MTVRRLSSPFASRLCRDGFELFDEGAAVNWAHLSLANRVNDFDALSSSPSSFTHASSVREAKIASSSAATR